MTQPAAPASQPLVQPRLDAGSGFPTLLRKELLRFWKVSFQTIAAPVITALLYLLVFAHVLEGRVMVYGSVPYTAFLIPAHDDEHAAERLRQSVVVADPKPHHRQPGVHAAAAAVAPRHLRRLRAGRRGARHRRRHLRLVVALYFVSLVPAHPLWLAVFAVLACGIMGVLGLIAGLWSEKFDQLAAFQNFLIMPATFLSGVFYSIHTLPAFWQGVSHWNPIFYTIDGFRYGFFAVSDVSPWRSLAVVAGCSSRFRSMRCGSWPAATNSGTEVHASHSRASPPIHRGRPAL